MFLVRVQWAQIAKCTSNRLKDNSFFSQRKQIYQIDRNLGLMRYECIC